MGQYSYTQPSSTSINSVSSTARRRASRRFGVPNRCQCGLEQLLVTSTTLENPGRRFYGCDNHVDGLYHVFKWWDEAIMEEFEEMRLVMEQHSELIHYPSVNERQAIRDYIDKPDAETIRLNIRKSKQS